MAIRMRQSVQTATGTYEQGDIVTGLSPYLEAQLLDGGSAELLPGNLDVLTSQEVKSTKALVSRAGIEATDVGTDWVGAPSLLAFSATLTSGTSTTVLLEVRDTAGSVTTAATIVADTVSQVLRQSFLLRQQAEYRFRRSSGTGSVTINL